MEFHPIKGHRSEYKFNRILLLILSNVFTCYIFLSSVQHSIFNIKWIFRQEEDKKEEKKEERKE
jgi:hypothetical protein